MSIEKSCASSATKSAGSAQVGHVKGKSHPSAGAGQAETGDFSSLLMTLGADEAGDSGGGQDVPALLPVVDEALLDPGLLLAQSTQLQPDLPRANGVPGKSGELVAADVSLAAVQTGFERAVDAVRSGPESARLPAPVLPGKEQDVHKLPAPMDAVQEEKKELPRVPLGIPKGHVANDASHSGQDRFAAEHLANKLRHDDSRMAQSFALPQTALAAAISEPGVKQAERATERSAFKQIGGGEGGVWGYQALVEAGRIDPPSSITGASALSPEMMVAEQVNYWIGRDVQNAELKVDGLGEGPVKVSISLQGNEAHVEFRTDQAETRQVLEGAVSHLKDLLDSEGLVLSSVSVGGSGSRGDDPRERKPAEHSRHVAVKTPEALAGEATRRPARLSGRTVDLFV